MVRRHNYGTRQPGSASEFARLFNQLPEREQQAMVEQVQAALRLLTAADGEAPGPRQGKPRTAPRPRRHIRFEGGEVRDLPTVLNSARSARAGAAWDALAESGRQIGRDLRKGHR